jgi:hypothetical protein
MAAAAHFSARIYGAINGNPPFTDGDGASAFSLSTKFNYAGVASFPTTGVSFWPLPNGFDMGGGAYVYSVIRVEPSGLNVHGAQYVTDSSTATLATLAS